MGTGIRHYDWATTEQRAANITKTGFRTKTLSEEILAYIKDGAEDD
jgi:hypothetical protein